MLALRIAWLYRDLEAARRSMFHLHKEDMTDMLAPVIELGASVIATLSEDYEGARNHADAFIRDAAIPLWKASGVLLAAEADLHLDGPDAATSRLDTLGPDFFTTRQMAHPLVNLLVLEALVALSREDTEEAEVLAIDALDRADAADSEVLRHLSLAALGVVLGRDPGGAGDASALLGAADRFGDATGAQWWGPTLAAELEDLRARMDRRGYEHGHELTLADATRMALSRLTRAPRATSGWAALTPAEQRVVELVADGLSNLQIAEKLFIGISTVKTHLVHGYQKLGIESRPALVAAASSRPGTRRGPLTPRRAGRAAIRLD